MSGSDPGPPEPGKYRHYKGGIYHLVWNARRESDNAWMCCYTKDFSTLWIRPASEWSEVVSPPGVLRFLHVYDDERAGRIQAALYRVAQWADAYPLDVFPEPDSAYLKKAHEVLTANGMTLDAISARAMRHVITGVGKIAKDALK